MLTKPYPKDNEARTLGLPADLVAQLDEWITTRRLGPDERLFATREGTPISRNTFRTRIWLPPPGGQPRGPAEQEGQHHKGNGGPVPHLLRQPSYETTTRSSGWHVIATSAEGHRRSRVQRPLPNGGEAGILVACPTMGP
jgi:hypothetical protein